MYYNKLSNPGKIIYSSKRLGYDYNKAISEYSLLQANYIHRDNMTEQKASEKAFKEMQDKILKQYIHGVNKDGNKQ